MIYKTQTTYPLETVKAQLQDKAKALGFGVLGSYDFKELLKNRGFELTRDVTVYELCNPAAAHNALNNLPEISVYLPCKLSIYRENNMTVLATIGIEDMLSSTTVEEPLKEHLQEIFNNVRALMNSW
ncbi:DUF302 domain-containing protein [Sulfurimonas paralvinellae]|uniref:DUF302 domain-containing protein n=1 Tax=Sulfurimonas paralvinellae TaxID=317658 RepID=A0A7M1BAX4_9BACT|nr:DUF302 domain-containing protein [Sulfurimonas paralvinellae]QOP46576.1 DUF302 domain-containing protein [Sulfurimonas paralvinellae]